MSGLLSVRVGAGVRADASRLRLVSAARGNGDKGRPTASVGETEVELTLGTRDAEHCDLLVERMRDWGYPVERLR
jgi:hypothetical protein